MAAYYNEIDAHAAAWLRELIKRGLIADGEVDTRSIVDVHASDLAGFVQCHFFAGIGGWSRALRIAGWIDDRECWTGSCPCQPFSSAGSQAGGDDPRHLWPAWFRLIRERQPGVIFGEQVENAVSHGWLDLVFDDLERESYATGACDLPALVVGAPHLRRRIWFVADAHQNVMRASRKDQNQDRPTILHLGGTSKEGPLEGWWSTQPEPCSVVYGLPGVVDILRPFGNGIVPQAAAAFIEAYLAC